MQRTWDATLATPVTLTELLAGEALWAATKAHVLDLLRAAGRRHLGRRAVPERRLAGAAHPAYRRPSASPRKASCYCLAKSFDFFSYFFTFWTTPMFVFSGVFFELERFPVRCAPWPGSCRCRI